MLEYSAIYALTKNVIFAVTDEELKEGEDKLAIVLERQLSHFSDLESFGGLLHHLGDSPWAQIFTVIAEGFNTRASQSAVRSVERHRPRIQGPSRKDDEY